MSSYVFCSSLVCFCLRFLAARGNAFVGLFTLVGRRDMLFANFRESRAGNLSICPFGSTTRLRSSLHKPAPIASPWQIW